MNFVKASSLDEASVTSPFTGSAASSSGGEMAIDESASTVSLIPNPPVVPNLNVAVLEREECIREFLDPLSAEEGVLSRQELGSESDDDNSFVYHFRLWC